MEEGSKTPTTAAEIVSAALAGTGGPGVEVREEPRDPGGDHVEDLLAAIVAGALGLAEVHREIPFSALGGDSLAATRVLSRTSRVLGVNLPLSALAPDVSVRALSATVRRARSAAGACGQPLRDERRLRAGSACNVQTLSVNQAAVWFGESEREVAALYTIAHCLRLRGALDVAALHGSLNRLLARHDALRIGLEERDGRILQRLSEARVELELPISDLRGLGREAGETFALEQANAHIRAPFDLARAPLLRALLLRLAGEEHLLALAVHHLVCDAWSLKLMMRELGEDYRELTSQHGAGAIEVTRRAVCPSRSDREAPGFLDYIAWQREAIGEAQAARMVAQWRELLGDVSPATALRTDRARPQRPSGEGAAEPIELGRELVERLRSFGADQGVTLYMTLACAFATVLMHHGNSTCMTLGAAVANRADEQTAGIVGYLANMVPLRVDGEGDPTLRELLRRVRVAALHAYDLQALPFARLVGALAPHRQPAVSPLFQAAIVLDDVATSGWGRVEVSEVTLHTRTAKLDLTCYLEERSAGELGGYLEYATELFHPNTIHGLRVGFERLLKHMLDEVDQPLSAACAALERVGAADRTW